MNIQNYRNRNKIKQKQRKENKMVYLKIDEKVFIDTKYIQKNLP